MSKRVQFKEKGQMKDILRARLREINCSPANVSIEDEDAVNTITNTFFAVSEVLSTLDYDLMFTDLDERDLAFAVDSAGERLVKSGEEFIRVTEKNLLMRAMQLWACEDHLVVFDGEALGFISQMLLWLSIGMETIFHLGLYIFEKPSINDAN